MSLGVTGAGGATGAAGTAGGGVTGDGDGTGAGEGEGAGAGASGLAIFEPLPLAVPFVVTSAATGFAAEDLTSEVFSALPLGGATAVSLSPGSDEIRSSENYTEVSDEGSRSKCTPLKQR